MTTSNTASSSTTAAGSTTNTGSILTNIENALSADAQKVVAFFQQLEQGAATVVSKIAAGAEILVEDVETLLSAINSKLGVITAGISATSTLAAAVAPNDTNLQKLISDVQTGVNDAAAVSTSLSTGSTAGQNSTVTTAVTVLNSVNTIAQLAAQAATIAGQAAAASPTATQTVSAPTPPEG